MGEKTAVKFTPGLEEWLVTGNRGISSNTMVEVFEGMPRGTLAGRWSLAGSHPHDPSDLRRCIRLLDAVPAYRARIQEMCEVSITWCVLVQAWGKLEAMLREEVPGEHGNAPRTYAEMKRLIEQSGAKF